MGDREVLRDRIAEAAERNPCIDCDAYTEANGCICPEGGSQAMTLRVVSDESDPLSQDELQQRGNQLLVQARNDALRALRVSMQFDLVDAPRSYSPYAVKALGRQAAAAVAAWQKVAGTVAELNREFEKANNAARGNRRG